MRLLRLAALFGSLMLLTATVVLLVERRSDVRDDQESRARGAADAAFVAVDASLAELRGTVDRAIASLPAEPTSDDVRRAADLVAEVADGASACVAARLASACSGDDLLGLTLTGRLVADDQVTSGGVAAAVDVDAARVVVVGRAAPTAATDADDPVTVVVTVPVDGLLSETASTRIERLEATAQVVAVDRASGDEQDERGMVDGRITVVDPVVAPFADGALELVVSVDGEVGMFGGSPSFFALLIGLGSVLLVLAAGTFLADRRNLEEQAATDELTGLANRREFERLAAESVELADRFGTGLTIMVVDLDGFKQINDSLGHQYGDLVLKGVADRLDRAVRDTDTVGRWGGDEFVIVLPGLDEASAIRSSAERITANLSSTPVVGDTVMHASIGAAAFPRHGATFDTLLRTADAAMYAAKTTGVPYRVADAELARRANGTEVADEPERGDDELVVTTNYVGPDRRAARALPDSPVAAVAADDELAPPGQLDDADDVTVIRLDAEPVGDEIEVPASALDDFPARPEPDAETDDAERSSDDDTPQYLDRPVAVDAGDETGRS